MGFPMKLSWLQQLQTESKDIALSSVLYLNAMLVHWIPATRFSSSSALQVK